MGLLETKSENRLNDCKYIDGRMLRALLGRRTRGRILRTVVREDMKLASKTEEDAIKK